MEIILTAVIEARPGREAELEALLKGLQSPTHAEPGCVTYALHRSTVKPGRFVFIEKWATQAALDAHLASPHIKAAFARKDELISVFELEFLSPLPATAHPAGKI